MTQARRFPPGRAGRLRLRHSLEAATRGADLLEEKLRVLRGEYARLRRAEETAAQRWRTSLTEAERWLLRGLLLSGEQALGAAAAGTGPAEVTVEWALSMGVRHPAAASCTVPPRDREAAPLRNTALVHAETAYREALLAAAEYAAANTAARIVGEQLSATRRRVRALRHHWIPRLTEALARADLAVEQAEHEDTVRRLWAAEEQGP